MTAILQRVCWNTRGWTMPSGSTQERGFPGENGFGHEEWNFQTADIHPELCVSIPENHAAFAPAI